MFDSIIIRNFQCLHNVDISLGKFTVIVGPTDVGKSAFIRAVRAAVDNKRGDSFILDNADFCTVSFNHSTPSTNFISTWMKYRKKGGEYFLAVSGEEAQQINQDDFIRITNMKSLRFAKGYFTCSPNFHHQLEPHFLISASPNFKSKVLAEITNASLILLANNEVKKINAENSGNLSWWTSEQSRLEIRHQTFAPLQEIEPLLKASEDRLDKLKENMLYVELLDDVRERMESIVAEYTVAMRNYQLVIEDVSPQLEALELKIEALEPMLNHYTFMDYREGEIIREVAMAQKCLEEKKVLMTCPDVDLVEERVVNYNALLAYAEKITELDHQQASLDQAIFHEQQDLIAVEKSIAVIKVCPLCERPMEDGHEASSHQ